MATKRQPDKRRPGREPATVTSARIAGRYLIIATILGAVVTAALTNGFGVLTQDHPATASASGAPTGPPVRIDSVTLDTTSRPTFGFVFPQKLILTASQLAALNKLSPVDPRYSSWFISRGAVPPIESVVKLVIEGNRTHAVQVIYTQIEDQCSRALRGTYFLNSPPGGGEPNVNFYFDLDNSIRTPQIPYIGGNYFHTHTVSLKQGESITLEIGTFASVRHCLYSLQLTVVDGTKTVIENVNNNGRPFEVTGVLVSPAHYQALYIGGKLPGQVAPFSLADPVTYKQY